MAMNERLGFGLSAPDSGEADLYTQLESLSDDELEQLKQQVLAQRSSSWLGDGSPQGPETPEEPGFFGDIKDMGVQVLGGIPKAAAGIVSLGSMVPGVHYLADPLARGLTSVGETIEEYGLSDYQLEMNKQLGETLSNSVQQLGPDATLSDHVDNIVAQGGAAADYLKANPGQTLNLIAESLPYILGGGVMVKGLQGASKLANVGSTMRRVGPMTEAESLAASALGRVGSKAAPALAPAKNLLSKVDDMSALKRGALGEGLMITGTTAQGITDATQDEGYTAGRLLAPLAGAAGFGTGVLGGKIAGRLGMGDSDIDTMVARALSKSKAAKADPKDLLGSTGFVDTPKALSTPFGTGNISRAAGTLGRMGVAGGLEGVVEELPQSVAEQMVTNVGAGKNALEDVGGAAVLGTVAGIGMGAPLGARRTRSMNIERDETQAQRAAPMQEIAPEDVSKLKPGNINKTSWAPIEEQLRNATTRAEAEEILRNAPPEVLAKITNKDGEFTKSGQKIIDGWKTPLDLKKPAGVKKSLWAEILPQIEDARTQEGLELALRRNGNFTKPDGTLNKAGRNIVTSWQIANEARIESAMDIPEVDTNVAVEPDVPPEQAPVVEPQVEPEAAPVVEPEAEPEAVAPVGKPAKRKAKVKPETKAADEETIQKLQKELDKAWDGKIPEDLASKKTPKKTPKKKAGTPKLVFTTPTQRMGLVVALQGYMPELKEDTEDSPVSRITAIAESLKDMGPDGQAVYDSLLALHEALAEQDAAVREAGKVIEVEGKGKDKTTRKVTAAERNKAIARVESANKLTAEALANVQGLVGAKNLRAALKASKSYFSTLTSNKSGFLKGKGLTEPQTTGLTKIGSDTSEGVRLSRALTKFNEGSLQEPGVRGYRYRGEQTAVGLGVAGKKISGANAELRQKLLDHRRRFDQGAPSRLADILDGDLFAGAKRPRTRLHTYLDHVINTADTPYTRFLARRIKYMADLFGILNKPDAVNIVVHEGSDKRYAGLARFNENYTGAVAATQKYVPLGRKLKDPAIYVQVEIFAEGQNQRTVLHELLHVVTAQAIWDKKFQKNASYKQFVATVEALKTLVDDKTTMAELEEKFRDDPRALATVKEVVRLSRAKGMDYAVAELVTYGFTETGFQKVLMSIKAVDGKLYRDALKPRRGSLWSGFVSAVKRMMKAFNMSDTEFERFIYASNKFMEEIEASAGASEKTKGQLASLTGVQVASEAYNPKVELENGDVAKRAKDAQRAKVDGDGGVTDAQKKAAKEREEKEKKRAESIRESAAVRKRRAAEAKERNTTAVLSSGRTSMDVTWLDRVERNVLNAIVNMIPGSSGDYQADIDKLLSMSSEKISAFLKKDASELNPITKAIQTAANAMGAGVVSNYGQPEALREKLHRLSASFYALGAEFSTTVQDLGSLPKEQQVAILQYLESGEESAITDAFGKTAIDKEKGQAVLKFAKRLETLFEDAKAAGLVEYDLIKEGVNVKLIDFVRLYNDPAAGRTVRQSVRKMGIDPKEPKNEQLATISEKVNDVFIYNKDGKEVSSFSNPTVRYYKLLSSTGEAYFVDTRASAQVVNNLGLVPDLDAIDSTYRARNLNSSGEVTMTRLKTAKELVNKNATEAKYQENIIASLAVLGQNMGRVIENRKFFDSMIAENAGPIAAEDRWILNGVPEGVSAERITELSKDESDSIVSLTKKMFGKGHVSLRAPGHWVTIPEDASDARWNGLKGMTVAAPVFSGILDMYDARPMVDSKMWRMVNSFWKKNVTVFSPVAHMNNIMGNFVLAYSHDITASNIKQGVRLTLIKNLNNAQLAKLGIAVTARDKALIKEISDAGIELITFRYGDLDSEAKDDFAAAVKYLLNSKETDSGKVAAGKMAVALENVWAALKKTDEVFTKAYSEQDNIFRIAGYITHFQNASRMNGDLPKGERKTVEQLKDEAGRFARAAFVDYDIKAPWINALRHGKFGGIQLPFVSWTYRMVPIMGRIAVTKPWKLANIIGTVYALNQLSYALLGGGEGDDDREERERTLVPDYWAKSIWGFGPPGYIRLPFGTGDSGYIYNLGNAIPLSSIFDWREGENLPGTLMPGGAGLTFLQAAFNYDFFKRKEIVPEFGGSESWGGDLGGFLMSQNSPRIAVDAFRLGNKAIAGEKNALGQDPNYWVQFAKVLGVNVREINWKEQQLYTGIEVKKIQREAKAAINKRMRQYYRNGSEPDYAELYEELRGIQEKMQDKIKEKLGVE